MARTVKTCQPPAMRTEHPDGNIAQDVTDRFASVFEPSAQWRVHTQWKVGTFADDWEHNGSSIWWQSRISPQSTPPPFDISDVHLSISTSGLGTSPGTDLIPVAAFKFLEASDGPDTQKLRVFQLLFKLFE